MELLHTKSDHSILCCLPNTNYILTEHCTFIDMATYNHHPRITWTVSDVSLCTVCTMSVEGFDRQHGGHFLSVFSMSVCCLLCISSLAKSGFFSQLTNGLRFSMTRQLAGIGAGTRGTILPPPVRRWSTLCCPSTGSSV